MKQYSDITLLVGPEKKEFHAHKVILINRTKFFKSAITKGLREIEIPDVEVITMEIFLLCIYSATKSEQNAFFDSLASDDKAVAKFYAAT